MFENGRLAVGSGRVDALFDSAGGPEKRCGIFWKGLNRGWQWKNASLFGLKWEARRCKGLGEVYGREHFERSMGYSGKGFWRWRRWDIRDQIGMKGRVPLIQTQGSGGSCCERGHSDVSWSFGQGNLADGSGKVTVPVRWTGN
jgi:hypothetical protein